MKKSKKQQIVKYKNRYKKGHIPWIKGKKHSKKTRKKMIENHKGSLGKHWKLSEEAKKNIKEAALSFFTSKAGKIARRKIRKDNLKNPRQYWLGRKRPEMTGDKSFTKRPEVKEKIRKAQIKRIKDGKHNWWKGGISNNPYSVDWTETLRRSIRERDHYICQLCNQYGKEVHHIDYNKQNSNPDNLITLCHHCHLKTNQNRKYWEKYFNEK